MPITYDLQVESHIPYPSLLDFLFQTICSFIDVISDEQCSENKMNVMLQDTDYMELA